MASLEETLREFESESNKFASVELKVGTTPLLDNILSRKRRYVRDANETEEALAIIALGEPILRLANTFSVAASVEEEIYDILCIVTRLNEICKNPQIEAQIQNLLAVRDRYTNSAYLKKTHDQKCLEIDSLTVQFTEVNTAANIRTMKQYEEIREAEQEDQLEVSKLQAEFNKLKEDNELLVKRESDYIRIGQDIKEKALQGSLNPELPNENKRSEIEKLEQEKEELDRLILQDDALLEEDNDNEAITSRFKELYEDLCAEIEELTNSPAQVSSRSNIAGLLSKLGSVKAGLNERLVTYEAIGVNEKERSVYHHLLTFFHNRALHPDENCEINVDFEKLNEVFPHITSTTVSQLLLSDTSSTITAILLKLYDEEDMTLQNLVTYVEDFSKEHGVSNESTHTVIYSLVAADLVVIDRTHKDSLVRLKL